MHVFGYTHDSHEKRIPVFDMYVITLEPDVNTEWREGWNEMLTS